jgi:hypothetical protein
VSDQDTDAGDYRRPSTGSQAAREGADDVRRLMSGGGNDAAENLWGRLSYYQGDDSGGGKRE